MPEFGVDRCRIKLDQDVARFDALAVTDLNCVHDSSLERLNCLRAAARNDLAGSERHDIHGADTRPDQRYAEDRDDAECYRTAERRRWRFNDLECGRQEGK